MFLIWSIFRDSSFDCCIPNLRCALGTGRPPMRTLVVQYAGDYREANHRLQTTGTETYYGHRYVLEGSNDCRRSAM
jgi:hypothetical protein